VLDLCLLAPFLKVPWSGEKIRAMGNVRTNVALAHETDS
jgi:hypothetical protein